MSECFKLNADPTSGIRVVGTKQSVRVIPLLILIRRVQKSGTVKGFMHTYTNDDMCLLTKFECKVQSVHEVKDNVHD